MASANRTSIPVVVKIADEGHEGRIVFATVLPNKLSFDLVRRDRRKKVAAPWPIEITFQNSKEAHESVGKVVTWIEKH